MDWVNAGDHHRGGVDDLEIDDLDGPRPAEKNMPLAPHARRRRHGSFHRREDVGSAYFTEKITQAL
jgi:hypothetical protein